MFATAPTQVLVTQELGAIPMFLLMGSFTAAAGLSGDLYRLFYALLGHYRGGLAMTTIAGCGGFGAICGSSLATASTFMRIALPEMVERSYRPTLAVGSIAAGGTLGILIPPSNLMLLYAVLTEQFVTALFTAAVIPGLICIAISFAAIAIIVRLRPGARPTGARLTALPRCVNGPPPFAGQACAARSGESGSGPGKASSRTMQVEGNHLTNRSRRSPRPVAHGTGQVKESASMKTLLSTFAILLGITAAGSAAAQPFVFTAIPDQDETALKTRFNRIANYLQGQLGVEVKYVPVKSYAAAVTAFRNNQVQLAWFGGLSGVRARAAVSGSQAIAQGEEDKSFRTYFIAHASTGLEKSASFPDGIAGKTFTFGSKGSTSGRLMPEFFIRRNLAMAPGKAFRRVGFSGDHSRTIALVQSGAFEVGAVNYAVWDKELAAGKIDAAKVKVIWVTPPYPDYNWSIRGDADKRFGAGFTEKVRGALLGLDDPNLLKQFPRKAFIPASNADYQPIVDVGRKLDLID